MQGPLRWIVSATLLCGAADAAGQTVAGPQRIPWRSAQYSHIADDEPLPTLLREFAADQGVSIVVSEKVQGKVRGRFGPMPPQQYLETITRQNGLIWYYDGTAIFVYRGDELESEVFQLRRVQADAVLNALRDLDVPVEANAIRISRDGSLMHVVGPPRFVALVRNIGLRLEGTAVQKVATGLSVRVFPLRYSWAEDQTVNFSESTVTIPGVATVLRNLVGLSGKGPQGGSGVRKTTPLMLPSLAGKGLASVGENPNRTANDPYIPAPPGALASNVPAAERMLQQQQPPSIALETEQGQVPSIQAEPRLNAVIIQDSPDRFPVYESLIASLDVPVGLVEIEALMIDVLSNKNFSIGLPFNVATDDSSLSFAINPTDQANVAFTLVSGGVQRLLLQFQALAADGHAKVVGRPSVLTLDNIEAHLESTQTIYVRVPGTYQSDLFNIVVGTTLRVTPHIVDEGGQRKVKLQVRVEDGIPLNATVDGIPTIQRNSITTQAVLAEDQSLFIGGLARDDRNLQTRGIPWLKDLPRIGIFFRTSTSTTVKTERYVLLTPRLVSLEPPAGILGGDNGQCAPDGAEPPCLPIQSIPASTEVTTVPPLKSPSWSTIRKEASRSESEEEPIVILPSRAAIRPKTDPQATPRVLRQAAAATRSTAKPTIAVKRAAMNEPAALPSAGPIKVQEVPSPRSEEKGISLSGGWRADPDGDRRSPDNRRAN